MDIHLIASKKNRENVVNNALETNQKFYRSILEDYKIAKEDIKSRRYLLIQGWVNLIHTLCLQSMH